jgi:uncharacterized protein YcaQ
MQFDTINVVGRNADLVLQSRVKDYRSELLEELLYHDRFLVDGWDKMAAIFRMSDWPHFARRRAHNKEHHHMRSEQTLDVLPELLDALRKKGPLSSIDFDDDRRADWYWAETRLVRAGLEVLFAQGKIGIHHRVNTRRVFDLIENLVPTKFLGAPDPHLTLQEYQFWHLLRRIGSMGLASNRSGEYWGGIVELRRVAQRREALKHLIEVGQVVSINLEGSNQAPLFMRTEDEFLLDLIENENLPPAQASFIAPLDNLIWNRRLISELFDFKYTWEVYKPKKKRQYGYYVLPVLYGDRFIARFDPQFNRNTNTLTIQNWWWEQGVRPDKTMKTALYECMQAFLQYLDTQELVIPPALAKQEHMNWINKISTSIR